MLLHNIPLSRTTKYSWCGSLPGKSWCIQDNPSNSFGHGPSSRLGPCRATAHRGSSRVPPPWGRTPLRCSASADALQFGGGRPVEHPLYSSLQCYGNKFLSISQDIISLLANKFWSKKIIGATPLAQAKGVAPTLSVEIVLTLHPTSARWPHMGNHTTPTRKSRYRRFFRPF